VTHHARIDASYYCQTIDVASEVVSYGLAHMSQEIVSILLCGLIDVVQSKEEASATRIEDGPHSSGDRVAAIIASEEGNVAWGAICGDGGDALDISEQGNEA